MGTDLRKALLDGYPSDFLIGCDIRQTYIDQGHELFSDSRESCPITFFISDIFELPLTPNIAPPLPSVLSEGKLQKLEELKGRLSVIYAGALFHLFNEETQFAIAIRLLLLLRRPSASESGGDGPKKVVIFGRHQGLEEAGMIPDWLGR